MVENDIFSDILKFRDKYRDQWVILKYGGALASDEVVVRSIGVQAAFLKSAIGANVVIVHGAGNQVSDALMAKNITPKFDQATGRRITDRDTMATFDSVVRHLNRENVNWMQAASNEIRFEGMAGYDLDVVTAKSMGDFTGIVDSVRQEYFTGHLREECIPVFYSACQNIEPIDGEHRLNVNADEVAASIGASLNAIRLVLLSDTPGVKNKKGERITGLSTVDIDGLIEDGTVTAGMAPKLRAAKECAERMTSGGVVILDGRENFAVLKEILYEQGAGTLIRSPERIAHPYTPAIR